MQLLEVSAAVQHTYIYIYIYIYMSLGFKRLNKNPSLANACIPCFPQLHVDGSNIATEINATLFVSCVILTA